MVIVYILMGIIGGVLGGMGMGGGTLLIPILTLFFGFSQHTAQAINLVGFIPMAIIAIIIHIKNGLIKTNKLLYIILPAFISSAVASFIAVRADADLLSKAFGIFLILIGVVLLFKSIKQITVKK